MAIIRCPECNHEISTLAVTCPFCGVNIAGNILTCPDCGKILLHGTKTCPNCLCNVSNTPIIPSSVITAMSSGQPLNGKMPQPRRKRLPWPFVALLIILLLGGGGYFLYNHLMFKKSLNNDYTALENNYNTEQYISFLAKYPSSEYSTEIKERLEILRIIEAEWQSIATSDSISPFKSFLARHPKSAYTSICKDKIDSLDWLFCSNENTREAYQAYLDLHIGGKHITQARQYLEALDKLTVTPTEKDSVRNLIATYFTLVNQHNISALPNIVSDRFIDQSIELSQQLSEQANYTTDNLPTISKKPSEATDTYNYVAKFQVVKHHGEYATLYNANAVITSRMRIYTLRLTQVSNSVTE